MKVDIGMLRDKCEVVREQIVINELGFNEKEYITVCSPCCYREPIDSTAYFSANRSGTTLKYKFYIRRRELDESLFIRYKDKLYNIVHVYSDIRKPLMEILAEVRE
ncbi:head-tail adaptor protein [Clostridium perfringens]|uniref:phage head completion protein n=1 Tax=Clostridium perfringens TaxID=1502 RepID=UPI0029757A97|nr:head-tail adaptor protein [Clostridium perfringens]MDM0694177.1 head-tail adaptor protein [Clostridium perfringens]MDM0699722.1 head-tail adaptor protein [Clostridium perfringens]MDM0822434.1 head-tail adaptor protein [Clostridium perfringens]MDM0881862.1 head-tail adaptor protein [Clostridium perfringens]